MSKKITIKEISIAANVSIGTVDRVLHNRGRVADETRDKIRQIAHDGNYSSNVYARNLRLNKSYKLAVYMPSDHWYWQLQRAGIQRGVDEFGAMGISVHDYSQNYSSESNTDENITHILGDQPDGIILGPNIFDPDGTWLKTLNASLVPYVFVDSNIELADHLTFIGQNAEQGGQLAAGLLDRGYLDHYHAIVLTIHKDDLDNKTVNARILGFENFHKQKGSANATLHFINLEIDGLTMDQFRNRILSYESPAHIFVPNSKSHRAVYTLSAIKEQIKLRIVGYDLIAPNIELIKNGTLDYVIDQRPQIQGYLAMQALYHKLILKIEVPKIQFMPIDIITKDNWMYCQ